MLTSLLLRIILGVNKQDKGQKEQRIEEQHGAKVEIFK
jgi:hypothetical protein